ncbi:MAG TPA: hypothetical protein P5137_06720, partial [Candidatus Brocadiia bacterium]|nr:hypothetical protein [Candidatus Brocadiia bacterium]
AQVNPNPAAQYHGHRDKVLNDPFHPDVAKWQNDENAAILAKVRDLPGVKTCFFNSEVEDDFNQLEAPNARRGLDASPAPVAPHQFILPGVIADNDAGYARRLYLFKHGDGLAAANRRAAGMAHRVRPDLVCFTDPCRLTTALDRFAGMDLVSTWTYTNPDPKLMLFIETLIAHARARNQGVMHTVTLLNYAGSMAPKEMGWTLMGPDRLIETLWINLSRRPDGLGLYLSSSCDPFDMPAPQGVKAFWSSEQKEPWQKYPPTWEAMRAFSRNVIEPFGPMIRKLSRAPRKAAVLSSEASRLYRASPKLTGYYDNYQVYHFYTLLAMCHIPADVVFDETIAEQGLDAYDALFLPHCETLPETVYRRILDFERRGGLVVTDQYFRAPVPNTVKTEFDFVYRRGVTATAIRENAGHINWGDDHLDVNTAPKGELKGFPADEDQKTLEKYAAELRRILGGRVARDFDCSSPTALLNMLESGEAKYLFVVNDKRTFDERVGAFKAMMEKALPQTVTVTLYNWRHASLHAFDLLERKALDVRPRERARVFDVDLPAPGGKIIALLPAAPAKVEIRAPQTVAVRGAAAPIRILISGEDGAPLPGVQPLRVTITDPQGAVSEFSGHYAAESGALALDFIPAANDAAGEWTIEAQELISGVSRTRKLTLAPA